MGGKDFVLETLQHKGHLIPHSASLLFSQKLFPQATTLPHISFFLETTTLNHSPHPLFTIMNIDLSPQFADGIQQHHQQKGGLLNS